MTGAIAIFLFLIYLAMGMPIFFVLAVVSCFYFWSADMSQVMVLQRMFVGLDQFVIMAVPMFILAGKLMAAGGTLHRLIDLAVVLVGHVRGGLAQVNIVASMFFSGISGSATADVSALGPIEIEMMKKGRYPVDFATAVTISSSVIGPIVPPSIPLVIYGVVASTSIGNLFLAGIVPGLLMGIGLMILVYFMTFKFDVDPQPRASFKRMAQAFVDGIGPMGLPFIIIAGIYTGLFTPTEAAAVACVYAFGLGMFVYRQLKWRHLPAIMLESGLITASALSILAMSNVLSWIFTVELLPQALAQFLLSISENKYVVLLLINIGLLLLGCVMETLAAIIIVVPIFLPIVVGLGIDPVHFGVIVSINLTLGLLTPPLGLNLYIASAITGVNVDRIAYVNLPFLAVLITVLMIVTFVPELSLLLPNLMLN
ncbi:TRAP transporter large permease [Nitratireductor sp. ZSWI3]|uniref:TRAP transporter large permease n=1 Tax=Nitratireductor sp. ZSWI3 TaxID=2966359 RepID=UPI0021504B99|nr:TRAP transporter large permease [Nitratireductor sp. ZSWI3]MCR4265200.1 TRAP transporter large permease [Nitratireductor sp. ZSWI3]